MRLLLVDPHPRAADVAARLHRALDGLTIDRVSTLAEATSRVTASSRYEVLLAAAPLPDGGVRALFAAARAHAPSIHVVVLIDRAGDHAVRRWLEAGADEFLAADDLAGPRLWMVVEAARRRARAHADGPVVAPQDDAPRLTEAHLSAIVATAMDAIITVDDSQRIVVFNEAAEAIFRCRAEDVLGSPLDRFIPAEVRDAHRELVAALGRSGTARRMVAPDARVTGIRADGERFPCEAFVSCAARGTERLYTVILRDITERVRIEEQRTSLEAQLRQSQKMEAIGTLAGGIAHDFNNVLTAIIGNIEMAAEDVGPGHRAHASLAEAARASQRAKSLVQQILTFSRRQQLTRRPVALRSVAEEALRLLRATIPASVDLSIACPPDLPDVLADPTQILQALMNLCTNGWHALEGRPGRVAIGLQDVTIATEGPATRLGIAQGRYVRLSVVDTGRGMDAATRERIFEPFFTTKGLGQGTGLGLPVVLGIVEGHGGGIEVTSEPGRGSTFALFFPAIDQRVGASPAAAGSPARAAAPHPRRHRVVFIDDEPSIVALGLRILERYGYAARGYTTAGEALAALRANPEAADVLITDLDMPGMNGVEVAARVRATRDDLPVVLVSGLLTDEQRRRAEAAGVRAMLSKPFDGGELHQLLQQVLNATA